MARANAKSRVTYVDDESTIDSNGNVIDFLPPRRRSGSRGRSRSTQTTSRPTIYTSNRQLWEVADPALSALYAANSPTPRLFVHAGRVAIVRHDPDSGMGRIHCLDADTLRDELSRAANFFLRPGNGRVAVSPPMEVVRNILSRAEWQFPSLKGIVSTPVVRSDGSVLDVSGYDPGSQLYYQPAKNLEIPSVPESPTAEDVRAAVATIDDIIHDFPYASEVDRTHAFAVMLTPFVRPLIDVVPLAIFDAPKQGTGKSLHADILALIVTGNAASMTTAPTREEEWVKTLAGLLIDGRRLVALDNLEGRLNSSALASVLTSQFYGPRLLGTMNAVNARNNATWVGTANNVRLGPDLARRCYWIRLDAKTMHPEMRQGFRHPNLKAHVKQQRGQVIHALLTLARGWFAAGQPPAPTSIALGSFEEWTTIIGGILHFAGIEGFLSDLSQKRQQVDEETEQWAGFFCEWEQVFGDRAVRVAMVVSEMRKNTSWIEYLPEDLIPAFEGRTDQISFTKRLGKALSDQVDKRYSNDGLRLQRSGKSQNSQLWRVVRD